MRKDQEGSAEKLPLKKVDSDLQTSPEEAKVTSRGVGLHHCVREVPLGLEVMASFLGCRMGSTEKAQGSHF